MQALRSRDAATLMTEHAAQRDSVDPLRSFRDEFHIPQNSTGAPLVYLCGHSLGLQPRNAEAAIAEVLASWRMRGVEGHFAGARPWLDYHAQATLGLSQLTGAQPREVVAMNSLTVNLHLLLAAFYRPTTTRTKILIERNAFPSDRYAVESQIRWHGLDAASQLIEIGPRDGENSIRLEDLQAILDRDGATIATVLLPGVQYLSGQRFDIEPITRAAHRQGCVIGFDLAHAIGNVPLALHDSNVDFAVWCSYKYLNAGPGAIGGAFIHERHAHAFDLTRLAGWWGHDVNTRFAMPHRFAPISGAEGWQVSNPPILALAPLLASLDVFARAGLTRLREKSLALTKFLEDLLHSELGSAVQIVTPREPESRGSQLSLVIGSEIAESRRVHDQLSAAGIVCDWREPNVLRIAPTPLYNTFTDVATFADTLRKIVR